MRIGFIVPYKDIVEIAKPILEKEKADVVYIEDAEIADSVSAARKAIDAGAEIIISRGYQAQLIKQVTNIPVVELRLHSQEIGLAIKRAKQILKKPRPHIGLAAFGNMLCDMSFMGELFDVDLDIVRFDKMEMIPDVISSLASKGVEFFICGEWSAQEARIQGYPALIYKASAESILESLREVNRIRYATELENQNRAQLETVLDYTFNGIIKINSEAQVIVINKLVESIIGKSMEEVVGESLTDVIPEIDSDVVEKVLNGHYDNYSISVSFNKQPWVLLLAPIQYEGKITGAIISLQKIGEKNNGTNQIRDMFLRGYTAGTTFADIDTTDNAMKLLIEKAKKYALSNFPVLIYTEEGTEFFAIGEAIHNNSSRKGGPFVSVNLEALDQESQMKLLFGDPLGKEDGQGALAKATYGTLFIRGLDHAARTVQNQIERHLLSRKITRTDAQNIGTYDVRIIASTKRKLQPLVAMGEFSEGLYYMIQGLVLEIPSLRLRKADLVRSFERTFKEVNYNYGKYLVLTEGAKKLVQELDWPGNYKQLESFCEALVLLADRRSVDEVVIRKLYEQLYPRTSVKEGKEQYIVYRSKEEEELMQLLEKYHGNRKLIADELGISVTTLWRRMKKYGIED